MEGEGNHPKKYPSQAGEQAPIYKMHEVGYFVITFPVLKYKVFKEHNNNLITYLRFATGPISKLNINLIVLEKYQHFGI